MQRASTHTRNGEPSQIPLNSLCGISVNATREFVNLKKEWWRYDSQFPFWDFGECIRELSFRGIRGAVAVSQFPLWDFGECNLCHQSAGSWWGRAVPSQFPLWDFVQCNTPSPRKCPRCKNYLSQFPFWDFVQCNP
jgi:hypothetical protein